MSPLLVRPYTVPVRFPRVSGDEPATTSLRVALLWFSPRERG